MRADRRRAVRVALGFALVVASCPVVSRLATLGTRRESPVVVTPTPPQPTRAVAPGKPRPPWERLPPGRMVLYSGASRVVLDATPPSNTAKR